MSDAPPGFPVYVPGCDCSFCSQITEERRKRDALNILEARIADQEVEIVTLRRQVNTLRQVSIDIQRAHNSLVESVIQLCDILEREFE